MVLNSAAVLPSTAKLAHQKKRQSIDNSMIRFPKLDECAHFHYEFAELTDFRVSLIHNGTYSPTQQQHLASVSNVCNIYLFVRVHSAHRSWTVRRNLQDFRFLDIQLHKCILDRTCSHLKPLNLTYFSSFDSMQSIAQIIDVYLERFTEIVASVAQKDFLKCGLVLHWFEMDNRGNRLINEESDINTPAIGAAFVIKKHNKCDVETEISLEIGELVSVIEMPPVNESFYWKGKKGLEVGFFPAECVQLIDDKISRKSEEFSLRPLKKCISPTLRHRLALESEFDSFNMDVQSESSSTERKQSIISSLIRTIAPGRMANRKRVNQPHKDRVFGVDLCEHLANSSHDLPLVVTACCNYIEAKGLDAFGIYRLNGVASAITRLRLIFDEGQVPKEMEDNQDFTGVTDIHAVGSLIKRYFRELPNPLLTFSLHDAFIATVRDDSLDEETRIIEIRNLIISLPPPHWRTLRFLIRHFSYAAQFADKTGMTKRNLAIVWAPNLLRSRDIDQQAAIEALNVVTAQVALVDFLIRNCDQIFNREEHELNPPGPLYSPFVYPKHGSKSPPVFSKCLKYIDVGPVIVPGKYHTVIANRPSQRQQSKRRFNLNLRNLFTARSRAERSHHTAATTARSKADSLYSSGAQYSVNFFHSHNSNKADSECKSVKRSQSFDSYFKKLRTNCDSNGDAKQNNQNERQIEKNNNNLDATYRQKTNLKNDTIFEVEESMCVDGGNVASAITRPGDNSGNQTLASLVEQFETYKVPALGEDGNECNNQTKRPNSSECSLSSNSSSLSDCKSSVLSISSLSSSYSSSSDQKVQTEKLPLEPNKSTPETNAASIENHIPFIDEKQSKPNEEYSTTEAQSHCRNTHSDSVDPFRERIEKIKEARRLQIRERLAQLEPETELRDSRLPDVVNSIEQQQHCSPIRLRNKSPTKATSPWRHSGVDTQPTSTSKSSPDTESDRRSVPNLDVQIESRGSSEVAKVRYRNNGPKVTITPLQTINKRQRITDNQTLVKMFENHFSNPPPPE